MAELAAQSGHPLRVPYCPRIRELRFDFAGALERFGEPIT
jgi:hypothetical protein